MLLVEVEAEVEEVEVEDHLGQVRVEDHLQQDHLGPGMIEARVLEAEDQHYPHRPAYSR